MDDGDDDLRDVWPLHIVHIQHPGYTPTVKRYGYCMSEQGE